MSELPGGTLPEDETLLARGRADAHAEDQLPDDGTLIARRASAPQAVDEALDDATRLAGDHGGVLPEDATRMATRETAAPRRARHEANLAEVPPGHEVRRGHDAPAWPGAPGGAPSTLPRDRVVRVTTGQADSYLARPASTEHVSAQHAPATVLEAPHDEVLVRERLRRSGRRRAVTVIAVASALAVAAIAGIVILVVVVSV